MAIWNTTALVPNTLKRSEFPPSLLTPFPELYCSKVSEVVSNLQATHIRRICLEETRGEMKRRQTIQVHLVRGLPPATLWFGYFQKKKWVRDTSSGQLSFVVNLLEVNRISMYFSRKEEYPHVFWLFILWLVRNWHLEHGALLRCCVGIYESTMSLFKFMWLLV